MIPIGRSRVLTDISAKNEASTDSYELVDAFYWKNWGVRVKIAWVVDSASGIDREFAEANDIHVVPLQVIFEDGSYDDMVDITEEEFYHRLAQGMMPKSSQPSLGTFIELYERLEREGYDRAISLHMSGALSGTVNTARMAAENVDLPVDVMDSGIVAKPMLFILEEGLRLHKAGYGPEEILAGMGAMRDRVVGYFIVNDLHYLHRGGRLKATSARIGSLLQIKPILKFENQTFDAIAKVRTFTKAKEYLFRLLDADASQCEISEINVIHANYCEEAEKWLASLREKFRDIPMKISTLGTAVAVHSGAHAIGLAWTR